MKNSLKILKKANLIPVFNWKIRSKSEANKFHIIEWYEKEIPGKTFRQWHCSCPGFLTARKNNHFCRHIRIALNNWKEINYETENYQFSKN